MSPLLYALILVHLAQHAQQRGVGQWEVDIDQSIAKIKAPNSDRQAPRAPGYELVPGLGYYKLHPEVRRWHEALDACKKEGTHLLILNSEEEARAMNYFWQKYPNFAGATVQTWAWIGFHDQFKEGEYVTVFNDPLATTGFMKWSPSEPHGKNQDCGLLGMNFLLADFPCNSKQPFFCEKEL
ncbi:hemolymph lipopolysaccharide-binding protein-like [Periplaneta americana]|uniref:hemolymph lipopolysaccharide-binding protein-like n=1 Tax=Periplaneta americana TaxID=6978 RepID=UPI0037E95C03